MASMSVSGVVSGMDWESMIDSIIESATKPAQVQVNKRTNLTNKKSLFEEMKVTMNSIQTSLSPLKLPSTYKAKEIEIERIDSNGSYKGVLTATVNADAEVNVYDMQVKQLARAQTNRSSQINASTLKNTLGSIESSKIYINAGNQKIGVDVYNTDSLDSLKSRINTTLKTLTIPVGITASVVDNRLVLKSDSTGLGTTSVTGTASQRYNSSGFTDLSTIITDADSGQSVNIFVDDASAENLIVSSGSSKYTIHKDYEVVNNQIRWKQYEDDDTIKLGESVSAKYTMGKGDVYGATVKRGSDDTDKVDWGFDLIDNGTLADRIKVRGTTTTTETETEESYTLGEDEEIGTTTTTTTTQDEDGNDITTTITIKISESTDDDGDTVYKYETTTEITKAVDFVYGKDFTYSDGEITWLTQKGETTTSNEPASYTVSYSKDTSVDYEITGTKSAKDSSSNNTDDDVFDTFDIDEFNEAYKTATGEELATLTLTGSDGVIRTYLDPSDRSALTLTDDYVTEYEYGRDYVIRVADDGNGYSISWLSVNDYDRNSDGTIDIKDANTVVSDYIEAKNISLLNFQESPDENENFTLNIKADSTKDFSASVKSSDSDKDLTLQTLLGLSDDELQELADNDYADLKITDSDGNEYTYNDVITSEEDLETYSLAEDEFAIIDGKIVWGTTTTEADEYVPNAPETKATYTVYYESFSGIEATATSDGADEQELVITNTQGKLSDSDGNAYLSFEQFLEDVGSTLSASAEQANIDTALENYFSITDDDGFSYTYGDDFIIKAGDEDTETGQHKAVLEWITSGPTSGTSFTISYTGRGTGGGEVVEIDKAVTRSNSDYVLSGTSGAPVYSEFKNGTTTITQGAKTFYEGYDFEVGTNDDGNVLINWKTGTDWEWYFPQGGASSSYTINLTTESGESKTYTATRGYEDTLDLRNFGFSTVSNNGTLNSITYGGTTYDLTSTTANDDGLTPTQEVKENLGLDISYATNGGVRVFNFDWVKTAQTSREGLPGIGDEISIEYEYNTNTFTITDDGDGVVNALGLNSDVTEAQNAIIVLDGEEIERDLNNIGESYDNELIKGMTIKLTGVGEVSIDVSHDAEKAVESIQTFVDNYNSLMSWMNTRMTESAVDDDTAATIDSDDFRMRWGLLHGNALLRNTKSQMRDTVAQNFTFSFTSRTSTEEVYGTMAYNGLKNDSTLRLRFNSTYVDVPILKTDTLQDIVDKINNSENSYMRDVFYDSDGKLLSDPVLKAKVEGDKLVISSSSNTEITMSGSAAMNALKMNYTYKGIYQLGIATTSTDYGKSGELEFDTEKFMEALEDNPDEVESLMLKFASTMDSWTKSMLNSSASGQTSGTLTRQIEDIDTQIASIDEYLEKYQDRLDRMEESLRSKYSAAEQSISKLTQQASAMASILQQMTGSNSNSSSSS